MAYKLVILAAATIGNLLPIGPSTVIDLTPTTHATYDECMGARAQYIETIGALFFQATWPTYDPTLRAFVRLDARPMIALNSECKLVDDK